MAAHSHVLIGLKPAGRNHEDQGHGQGRRRQRWSSTCVAAWARVHSTSSNPTCDAFGCIEKYNSSGTLLKSLSVAVPDSGNDGSNMLGGVSYYYRVCIEFQGNEYPLKCSTKF